VARVRGHTGEQMPHDRSEQIERALERLVRRQRSIDFERIAFHIVRNKRPDLQLTEPAHDGGADAVPLGPIPEGKPNIRVASSLTASLSKIRQDCTSLRDRGEQFERVVFVTARPLRRLTADRWTETLRTEFGWDIEILGKSALVAELERPENDWICEQYLDFEDHALALPEAVLHRARDATRGCIAASMEVYGLQSTLVQPLFRLMLDDEEKGSDLVLDDIANRIVEGENAILTGVAGGGKTSALLCLAKRLADDPNAPIPVFIPLADWAADGSDFTQFAGVELRISTDEAVQLGQAGQVAWLLDGWNELPADQLRAAEGHLRNLTRRFPDTAVVVATRGGAFSPSLASSLTITTLPLTREQRRLIVETAKISAPARLLRQIEADPELNEITRIPLFLSTAIAVTEGGQELRGSGYELLAAFINHAERDPHRTALENVTHGMYRRYLEAMAEALIVSGTTRLRWDDALSALARCASQLRQDALIGDLPDAQAVLQTLIDHHLLVASMGHTRTTGFLHQRFQEWFGAQHLERCVSRVAAQGNERLNQFQGRVLDQPIWGEAVSLLAQRYAADGRDAEATDLIRWAWPIDIGLAAHLTSLVSDSAWEAVQEDMEPTLRSLVQESDGDVRDYALRAIAITQRPAFADVMWSRLRDSDLQVRARAYDVISDYGVGVLGADWNVTVRAMNEGQKAEFVHWIGLRGEHRVTRSVVEPLVDDQRPRVRAAAIEALAWRGYHDEAADLIRESPPELANEGVVARVIGLLPTYLIQALSPWLHEALSADLAAGNQIGLTVALLTAGEPDALEQLKLLVENRASTLQITQALTVLGSFDPDWVSNWVLDRMHTGDEFDGGWLDHVRSPSPIKVQEALDAALAESVDGYKSRQIISVIAQAAPEAVVARLIRELATLLPELAMPRQPDDTGRSRLDILQDTIRSLGVELRIDIVLSEELEPSDPRELAFAIRSLIAWGPEGVEQARPLVLDQRERVRTAALRWADELGSEDPAGLRAELALLLGAVGEPTDTAEILYWIDLDRADAQNELEATGRRRWTTYSNLYANALVRIGGESAAEALIQLLEDPEYIGEASRGLADLAGDVEHMGVLVGNRWQNVKDSRRRRQADSEPPHPSAGAISDALVRHLNDRGTAPDARPFAHDLGTAARALARLTSAETYALIPLLLQIDGMEWGVLDALKSLALDGHIIPVDVATQTADAIIDRFELGHLGSGDLDQGLYTVLEALSVLLCSAEPVEGVNRCRNLERQFRRSYHMRDLLERLGACASEPVRLYIEELLQNPDMQMRWRNEMLSALAKQPGRTASQRLMHELASTGSTSTESQWHLYDALSDRARVDTEFRTSMMQRSRDAIGEEERNVLATVFKDLEGEDVALAACYLLDDSAAEVPYQIRSRIEEGCLAREEADGAGAYCLVPASCSAVRRLLYSLVLTDQNRRESARLTLVSIEKGRLEHGRPQDETRHPDWSAAGDRTRPWLLPDSVSST